MFELTLSISICEQVYLKNLQKKLEEIAGDFKITIIHNEENRTFLAVAVGDEKKELLKHKILEEIVFIINDCYKYNYFKDKLSLFSNDLLVQPFLKAISIFDADSDYELIKNKLDFSEDIYIDRFFDFKLQSLKIKWEKTANVLIQNGIIASKSSMIEVIKYLISESDNFVVSADIKVNKDEIKLSFAKDTKIFSKSSDGISKLLTEIIVLNPLKINYSNYYCDETGIVAQNYLNEIFGDKIYL